MYICRLGSCFCKEQSLVAWYGGWEGKGSCLSLQDNDDVEWLKIFFQLLVDLIASYFLALPGYHVFCK
uniref:Uncharacterized protein n=1 Tax=Physcomitrium patens TaxID=3218 RepID=A0A7I3YZ55_PHYPA